MIAVYLNLLMAACLSGRLRQGGEGVVTTCIGKRLSNPQFWAEPDVQGNEWVILTNRPKQIDSRNDIGIKGTGAKNVCFNFPWPAAPNGMGRVCGI